MDLWNIAKTVGTAVFANAVPGGAAMLGVVNAFLPDDNKLPKNATGADVDKAVSCLTAEQKAELLSKQYDVKLAEIKQGNETLRAMFVAPGHKTRAKIALMVAYLLTLIGAAFAACYMYAAFTHDAILIIELNNAGVAIGTLTAPLVMVLSRYFGVLAKESSDAQNASNNFQNTSGLASLISTLKGK